MICSQTLHVFFAILYDISFCSESFVTLMLDDQQTCSRHNALSPELLSNVKPEPAEDGTADADTQGQIRGASPPDGINPETTRPGNQQLTTMADDVEMSHDADAEVQTDTESSAQLAFDCPTCGEVFTERKSLKIHANVHREKPYFCSQCARQFRTAALVRTHEMTVHLHNKPCMCPDCGKMFSASMLSGHRNRMHLKIKTHACRICYKLFDGVTARKEHVASDHAGVQPYVCAQCQKSFATKYTLMAHLLLHDRSLRGKYCCTHCDRQFMERKIWECHERTHTGDKPFCCELCDFRSSRERSLKSHVTRHSGIPPNGSSASQSTRSASSKPVASRPDRTDLRYDRVSDIIVFYEPAYAGVGKGDHSGGPSERDRSCVRSAPRSSRGQAT